MREHRPTPEHLGEAIFEALGGRKAPDGFMVRCPAHADRNPSLHVTVTSDDVLFKCFAGCEQERVIEALREMRLWPEKKQEGTNALPASPALPATPAERGVIYTYTDENHTPVHRVVRRPGKKFSQERFENGHWVAGLKDKKGNWLCRPVLYQLPALIAADPDQPVWLAEGEKDAEALRRLGLVATTNPMGAANWQPHYKEWLRGRDVILVEDNDDAGRKRTGALAEELKGTARSIRVRRFPDMAEHADVSDFVAAGGTAEQLAERLRIPGQDDRPRLHVVASMVEVQIEEVQWLWYPYIPYGKFTLMEGDPGVRKSWLSLAIAAAVSTGAPLPGDPGPRDPGRILLLADEDGLGDTVKPRLMAIGAKLSNIRPVLGLIQEDEERQLTLSAEGVQALMDHIEEYRPNLVIIDPLVAYTSSGVDMNKSNEVRNMLRPLAEMAERYRLAVLALRHLNKASGSSSIYRGQGSIDYFALSRSVLLVGKDPNDPSRSVMAPHKASLVAEGQAVAFRLSPRGDGTDFLWEGNVGTTAGEMLATNEPEQVSALAEAKAFLTEMLFDGPVAGKDVQRQGKDAGISERTLWRAKSEMHVHARRASGESHWEWALPDPDEGSSLPCLPSLPSVATGGRDGRDGRHGRDEAVPTGDRDDDDPPF